MRVFWAIAHNEVVQLYRDIWYLLLLTAGGMASLVIMAYTLSADIENVAAVVVDQDNSRESRDFIQRVINDSFFDLDFAASRNQAETYLQEGQVKVVFVIPANYGRHWQRGEPAQVQVLIDGSTPNVAELAQTHVEALVNNLSQEALAQTGSVTVRLVLEPRIRYNSSLKTVVSVIPGLMSIVLSTAAVGAAAAFGREYERGTWEMLICTPVGRWPLLLGRVFPYLLLGLFNVSLFIAISQLVFGVFIRGNLGLFIAMNILYLFAITSVGVFVAQFINTQDAAMTVTFMLFGIMPVYLSDIYFPVFTMPAWLQLESALMPATHFTVIARGIFLKGVGWQTFWPNMLALLATGTVMSLLAYLRLKKKLR